MQMVCQFRYKEQLSLQFVKNSKTLLVAILCAFFNPFEVICSFLRIHWPIGGVVFNTYSVQLVAEIAIHIAVGLYVVGCIGPRVVLVNEQSNSVGSCRRWIPSSDLQFPSATLVAPISMGTRTKAYSPTQTRTNILTLQDKNTYVTLKKCYILLFYTSSRPIQFWLHRVL